MGKTDQIGKITLDYSRYGGEDLYCDGQVEDELLEIVKACPPDRYGDIISEKKSWPVLYHLSPLRENIVEWLPIDKSKKVLEVGSGCGAITGAFAKKSGSVVCVDLSKKRSLINAYRHRDCENVKICVGNFKDIEPDLDRDFDYICLIGVFEYGQSYIGGDRPFEDFLEILMPHLAEGGRIVIAIENKYGLKYFAGCREDHLGTYFSGIENYAEGGGVRTFGRKGLEKIFASCGVEEAHFYYPYPDYKFMTALYSDAYLPGKGELSNNLRNFDRDRMLLFNEKNAFDGLVEEGLFPVFSNSYLVVLGGELDIKYVKYSNDRAPEYAVKTEISQNQAGEAKVRKYPLSLAAKEHIRSMEVACEKLLKRYEGGELEINRCTLSEGEELFAEFEFVKGTVLSELMDRCLEKDDTEGFYQYFREYVKRIGYHSDYPAADFDLIFSNILVDGEKWTLIDYEWTFGKPIDTKKLAYRAVYCYLLEEKMREKLQPERVLQELELTEEEAGQYREQEMEFQQFVTGDRPSMAKLRDLIGFSATVPQKWLDRYNDSDSAARVQIYEDRGEGCREEASYFVRDAYRGERLLELSLSVGEDVKVLRIDPAMTCCAVKILEMTLNGERLPLERGRVLEANGKIAKKASGKQTSWQPDIVFPTEDPNLSISMEKLKGAGMSFQQENLLFVRMELVQLPAQMAEELAASMKKKAFIKRLFSRRPFGGRGN